MPNIRIEPLTEQKSTQAKKSHNTTGTSIPPFDICPPAWTLTMTNGQTIGTFNRLAVSLTKLSNGKMLVSADYDYHSDGWLRQHNGAVPDDTGFSVQFFNGGACIYQLDCGINGPQLIALWCTDGTHVGTGTMEDISEAVTGVGVLFRAGTVQHC
jgi:hypothetical protein